MTWNRRQFLGHLGAAVAMCGLNPRANAQDAWPRSPVRVVSPYGAGGSNDISARIMCEELSKRLKKQFFVENKPGAGTRLANELVARAAPDGYTFLYAGAPFVTAELLYGKLAYDTSRDFQPVTLTAVVPLFLVVKAESPIKTVADLVRFAKSKSEGLTFAGASIGWLRCCAKRCRVFPLACSMTGFG